MEEKKEYLYSSLLLVAAEKHKNLLNIKEITMQQSKIAAADNSEDILSELKKLIDDKQLELEKLKKLEENFSKTASALKIGNWKELSTSQNKNERELYAALAENEKLSAELEVIDKINIRNMQRNMQELKKKLTKVKQGRRMINSYEMPYSSDAWFIDKKR